MPPRSKLRGCEGRMCWRVKPYAGQQEGVTKPIFHGGKRAIDVVQNPDGSLKRDSSGKPIGIPAAVREYSDALLIFLVKSRNPAIFGDRFRQEHSGPGNESVKLVLRSVLQAEEDDDAK